VTNVKSSDSLYKELKGLTNSKPASTTELAKNAASLQREVQWFTEVLETRFSLYFEQGNERVKSIYELAMPDLTDDGSLYAKTVGELGFNGDERLILILALLPHVMPHVLDTFFIRNKNFDRIFSEFGGWQGGHHRGFLPTIETAAFVIAGNDLAKRFEITGHFEQDHPFTRSNILNLEYKHRGEPFFCSTLSLSTEYLNLFTTGEVHKPDFSMHFPAKRLQTNATWEDLVLSDHVEDEVNKIVSWVKGSDVLLNEWGLSKVLKPGYRALFYGPPGTGKTLTASLIGEEINSDVYRIDLSSVVSKYIGETEKNLAGLFDQAEKKRWVLFFDEADALFGKRTSGSSSNDRHSNQEIAYLLQRIEDFPGVVILATNLRANIDEAFSRRFQSMIHFSMPDAPQRYQLWQKSLTEQCPLEDGINLEDIAEEYEIAGGAIINVVRYAAICGIQNGSYKISYQNLRDGIAKELRKEGKTL